MPNFHMHWLVALQVADTLSSDQGTPSLTDRVERAYFTGMAVHVATDLVMHELVNVYAGAYNILKQCRRVGEVHCRDLEAEELETHSKVRIGVYSDLPVREQRHRLSAHTTDGIPRSPHATG